MNELPEKPKSRLPLVAGVSAATALIAGSAFYFGLKSAPVETNSNTIIVLSKNETVDLKIKGNRNSRIYHLRSCPNYNDIAERNVVWFKTADEAKAAGFRLAKNC